MKKKIQKPEAMPCYCNSAGDKLKIVRLDAIPESDVPAGYA